MICGVSLLEIIALVGPERLAEGERQRVCEHFGVTIGDNYVVETYGNQSLSALSKHHKTMWVSVLDCVNPNFGHAVLFHDGNIYDPFYGINPQWPWSHRIASARVVNAP